MKLLQLALIFVVRQFRKRVLFRIFKKWEAEHGKAYFMDSLDRQEMDLFYKD